MIKNNQPGNALQLLREYKSDSTTSIYFHFIYGRALERLNRPFEALEHYRSAFFNASSEELKALSLLERAEGYLRIKNYYEAKTVFSIYLKDFNQVKYSTRANLGMAQSLAGIGLLPEALFYYEKAGEEVEAVFGKANILHRLGRLKEAHENYLKGISKDKLYFLNSEELLFYYGKNLQQMGNDQESVTYLNSKKIVDPILKKKADLALGLIALKTRKYSEAQSFFYSALSSPDSYTKQEALFRLAEAHLGAGNKKEAKQKLQEYRLKYPTGKEYEDTLLRLGKLELEADRTAQAVGWLKELDVCSSFKRETLTELEGIFLRLREKDPLQMVSLWNLIGHRLCDISREPFLLVMADTLKGNGKPYFELLQWLVKNGSEKVKIRGLMALTDYQIENGNLGAAVEGIRFMKNQKGCGDEILRLEARILHAKMDYGGVSEKLLSLKKMEPRDIFLLGETLNSARDVNKALAVFEKNLLKLGGNSDAYRKLADRYYEKRKKKEALQYYQKALENDPLNEWALYRASSLMAGEEARKMLERIKNKNSLLGKFAQTGLKELEIQRKMEEFF